MRTEMMPWMVRGMGLALGALIVYGVVQLGIAAGSVLLLLFLAILLASALEPMVGAMRSRLPLGRGASIMVVYLVFFGAMVGMAFVVIPAAVHQGGRIAASLPPFFDQAKGWAASLQPAALGRSLSTLIDSVSGFFKPAKAPDPSVVVEVSSAVAEAAVSFITLLAMVFFWLLEHARLQRYTLAYVPAARRAGARHMWNEVEARLGLWVRGQLMLMGAMGLATGTIYTILGVPGSLLLGLLAGLTEAIPIVGPLLGAIPALLVAATVSPQLMVVVAIVYVILQVVEGNVLLPMIMRNTIGISPLLVLVSLLVGAAVGGLVGAFLAVPLAASVEIVLTRFQDRATPVAQDAGAIETPDEETKDGFKDSLPDSAKSQA